MRFGRVMSQFTWVIISADHPQRIRRGWSCFIFIDKLYSKYLCRQRSRGKAASVATVFRYLRYISYHPIRLGLKIMNGGLSSIGTSQSYLERRNISNRKSLPDRRKHAW